ncbi:hypothetical protein DUI87_10182 [Hirundo rustica rustica]|uniref:Uncharacterized protein n=1 Tax=Hirundo rustica rustica TaxID=333673 RepID=A0A3M0KHE5_HIRRU|nr:hypothetical protein DUI87_10182 [Hirundo rustica rustica]
MVIEEGGPGPSKPAGDKRPRQREKDKQQDKQQTCEGFSIRAMMKNSMCLNFKEEWKIHLQHYILGGIGIQHVIQHLSMVECLILFADIEGA